MRIEMGNDKRRKFETGSQRDAAAGKGRFDLIPPYPLLRLARLFEAGAIKYDDNNWLKGQPLHVFLDSAERHLATFKMGVNDEDHLTACLWNLICLLDTQKRIELGLLPKTLADLPFPYRESDPRK